MSEETIPETPAEVNNTATPEPAKKKIPAKGFSLLRFEKRITATFSILAKVFVIALISVAIIFIARELSDDGFVIQQINVPESFQQAGFTEPVIAKRITNQLNEIIHLTRSDEFAQSYTTK